MNDIGLGLFQPSTLVCGLHDQHLKLSPFIQAWAHLKLKSRKVKGLIIFKMKINYVQICT